MSSSQNSLPSPSAIFKDKPKLKMPKAGARQMSTTPLPHAEGHVRDQSIWDVPDDDPQPTTAETKPAPKPRGRPRKDASSTKQPLPDGGEAPKKRGRPKKVMAEGEEVVAPKEKAPRKPRAKNVDEDGQTKIANGRVTKASAVTKTKKTDITSSHFAQGQNDFIDVEALPESHSLQLDKAGERRMDWTPAKDSGNYPFQMDANTAPPSQDDISERPKFGALLDNFGHSKTETSASTSTTEDNQPVRKRKLIELVKTSNASTTVKAKAAPKKARTITDKATAEYALNIEEETESAPILQYFTREDSGVDPSGAPRTKARKVVKKPAKGKKATDPVSLLLPPEAALQHAKRQDFVFGTSSQLARDEDPAFLRDLQQAMQLSNQYDVEDPFAEPLPSRRSQSSGKPSLWETALEIENQGAKDVEVLDLTGSSQAERQLTKDATPAPAAEAETSHRLVTTVEADGHWPGLDCTLFPKSPKALLAQESTSVRASSPSPLDSFLSGRNREMSCSATAHVIRRRTADLEATMKAVPETTPEEKCPDYDSYSTTDLAKEIASYKFKPVKKREDMVCLLQKCWQGRQKQAQGALSATPKPLQVPPPSAQPPQQSVLLDGAASPPRKRGRPRKGELTTASMRKVAAKPTATKAPSASAPALSNPKRRGRPRKILPVPEDISDAEGPPTPSPPRIRPSQLRSPPSLEIVNDSDDGADVMLVPLSPTSAQRELFASISKAVTTQPRSRDRKRLSWYEKILLYDPILLEDLTKWLNEEGLGMVGYDGEVQPLQVKLWCQRKSICCLFKESKRNRGVGGLKKIGRE